MRYVKIMTELRNNLRFYMNMIKKQVTKTVQHVRYQKYLVKRISDNDIHHCAKVSALHFFILFNQIFD